jgi:di/tricarboxylate transporter
MWIIGSFLGIDAIIPAAIIVFIFYSPGVRVLSATDFKEISWGIIFLVGAMLSVLNAMEDLGAIELIADFLFMYVPIDFNIIFLVGILLLFAAAIRTIFSSLAAAIAILLPILLEFASVLELNQLYLSLSLMLVLVSTSLLPFNISTVLLAHERGPLNLREVFLLGCMTMAFSFLVVFVSWLFYWPAIEGIVRFVSG